jgi:hypothetical protein
LKHLRFEKAWEVFKNEKYDPDKALRKNIGEGPVFCGDRFDQFAMKYRHRKWLKIWKLRDPAEPYKTVVNKKGEETRTLDYIARITIYDAFPFFQERFGKVVSVLIKMGYATKEGLEFIEEMKAKRGRFANEPLTLIKQYTTFELRYLARIMDVLRETLADLKLESLPNMKGLRLNAWYGPGAVAGPLLKDSGATQHYGPDISADNPSPQQAATHHAYFGGRIELMKVGYSADRDLHIHDLASAYPAALVELRSLKEGAWRNVQGGTELSYTSLAALRAKIEAASAVSMFRIDFQFPRFEKYNSDPYQAVRIPFYPLPFRTSRRAIYFPDYGGGWYMRDDVLAAIAWLERFVSVRQWKDGKPLSKQWEHKDTHFVIHEAWIYEPWPDAEHPFSFIRELYVQRREYKAAEPYDVREKFYKLPMNSLYGKTAQSVGGVLGEPEFREFIETIDAWDDEIQSRKITERRVKFRVGEAKIIKPPPTANPYYAAATTAYCRRRIMEAACLDPHSVIFFATDGIVSTNPIGGLPRAKAEGELLELGDWEYRKGHSGVFLQSGVYSYQKYENGELVALERNPFRLCRGLGVRRDHSRRPRNSFRIRPA